MRYHRVDRYDIKSKDIDQRHWHEKEKDRGADPEEPDEYRADNVFWVPKEARWSYLHDQAKQRSIGKTIDEAMIAGYQAHYRDQKGNVIGIKKNDPSAHCLVPVRFADSRGKLKRVRTIQSHLCNWEASFP